MKLRSSLSMRLRPHQLARTTFFDAHYYAQQVLWQFGLTCHSFYSFHLATVKVASSQVPNNRNSSA